MISGLFVGAALGFVMQRARFCMTGGFRDMYLTRNNTMFYAFLIAIAVQSVGLFTLISFNVIDYTPRDFPLIATIFGSFVFGVGIIYAGGCATGTWYRAGEGLIGSWIALFAYMVSAAIMKYGALSPLQSKLSGQMVVKGSIADTLGISNWVLVVILASVTLAVTYRTLRKPKIVVPSLPKRRSGINYLLFEKRWHPFLAAVLIGIIAFIAWPASFATGRAGGLGITTPSANIISFLVTGNESRIDWGVFLVLGLFVGSYIAAKGSSEFRWRLPDLRIVISSFLGGLLMGVGASLAGGCTIGNGLTNTAAMSWQGWISLLFMILGVWSASYIVYIRARQNRAINTPIIATN